MVSDQSRQDRKGEPDESPPGTKLIENRPCDPCGATDEQARKENMHEDISQQKIVIDDTVVDISGFRFIDDEMGKVGFDNFTEGAELLANASLGRDDLRVISSVTQRSLSSVG